MHRREMISTHPHVQGSTADALLKCIEECYSCAQVVCPPSAFRPSPLVSRVEMIAIWIAVLLTAIAKSNPRKGREQRARSNSSRHASTRVMATWLCPRLPPLIQIDIL